MKRLIIIILAVLCAVAVLAAYMVRRWSVTDYGSLDPRAAVLLRYIKASKVNLLRRDISLQENRRITDEKGRVTRARPIDLKHVVNMRIQGPGGSLPVRVYRPGDAGVRPLIVYYHGGGFYMGNLDTHDNLCRKISRHADAVVVSVDYRLAPEHRFPAAVDDAYAAVQWAHRNAASMGGDPSCIFVAGDSAGGTLSAAVAQLARERSGPPIACQILIYPATNLSAMNTESYEHFSEGFYLTKRYMEFFRSLYAPREADWKDIRISPLLAGTLKGLPPAVIVTAEFDPLRDEGEAYGERLRESGVPVASRRFKGLIHGFIVMDRLFPQSDEAVNYIAAEIRRLAPHCAAAAPKGR
ncbi:MAG: alpha/beta hydrolase [Spirochaetes bacterium]|nr:alpha/beta hydrolase [Spirochaetota bacterium]